MRRLLTWEESQLLVLSTKRKRDVAPSTLSKQPFQTDCDSNHSSLIDTDTGVERDQDSPLSRLCFSPYNVSDNCPTVLCSAVLCCAVQFSVVTGVCLLMSSRL